MHGPLNVKTTSGIVLYIVHTTIVYSAWRWLTKPKHVADDTLLIKLCLDLLCISFINSTFSRSQWPRCLRRSFAAARLLRSWVRIPPGPWIFVCCECRVLSGRGLCDDLITRPEESYRLWCVVVCDLETSRMRRPWPALGRSATKKKKAYSNKTEMPCLKQFFFICIYST